MRYQVVCFFGHNLSEHKNPSVCLSVAVCLSVCLSLWIAERSSEGVVRFSKRERKNPVNSPDVNHFNLRWIGIPRKDICILKALILGTFTSYFSCIVVLTIGSPPSAEYHGLIEWKHFSFLIHTAITSVPHFCMIF